MKGMHFNDLLKANGFDPCQVFLIRHAKKNEKAKLCRKSGMEQLLNYTRIQKESGFGGRDCRFWAVFDQEETDSARLLWFFENRAHEPLTTENMPKDYPLERNPGDYLYDLEKLHVFDELHERLVIEWKNTNQSGWRHLADETPDKVGYIRSIDDSAPDPFPGFDNLVLSYDRLEEVITTPERYPAWREAMSSINAIYLILDTKSGQQYIGSASGTEGLWGRWQDYVDTKGTGNNDLLKDLMRKNPERRDALQFSVLRVVDRTLPDIENLESKFKEKLGSRVFGLNAN